MDYREVANSPVLWMFAFAVFAVIGFQALRFYSLARENAKEGHATGKELGTAMRVGAISAVGPSIAVAIVALSLIPVFGTPVVLMRIGMVGSVPYEVAAANASADAMGVPLGGEGFTSTAFATVFFTMAMGAAVWMLQVIFLTSSLGKASDKIARWRPWVMSALTGGALLGAFSYLTINQAKGGTGNIIVIFASGTAMAILLFIAEKYQKPRIKEWALGVAMIVGLIAAGFVANS